MAAADTREEGMKTAVASEAGLGAGASTAAASCTAVHASRTTNVNAATSFIFIATVSLVLSPPPLSIWEYRDSAGKQGRPNNWNEILHRRYYCAPGANWGQLIWDPQSQHALGLLCAGFMQERPIPWCGTAGSEKMALCGPLHSAVFSFTFFF